MDHRHEPADAQSRKRHVENFPESYSYRFIGAIEQFSSVPLILYIRRLLNFICIVTLRYSIPFSGYMNLCRKCIQFLLIKSCGSSWWELYRVRFVRGTIFVVVVTSHPNIVQLRFPIILPSTNYA